MDLADEFRVQERKRRLSLLLPGFHEAEHSVLVLHLLAVGLELAVDLEAILQLLLEHIELLLDDRVLLLHFASFSPAVLENSHLRSEIVNSHGHLGLPLCTGALSGRYAAELDKFALNDLVELDLSTFIDRLLHIGNDLG